MVTPAASRWARRAVTFLPAELFAVRAGRRLRMVVKRGLEWMLALLDAALATRGRAPVESDR